MRFRSLAVTLCLTAGAFAACGDDDSVPDEPQSTAVHASTVRIGQIEDAVQRWRAADDIVAAHAAAEEARNLVTGPDTLGAGDIDGDGTAHGLGFDGLLPGAAGSPGQAAFIEGCDAVDRDVLGGTWDDPAARWEIVADMIESWSETNNPFPRLPSHPQRIVGWATLTLRTEDLDQAHEFAGHAQIHVDVTREALEECAG